LLVPRWCEWAHGSAARHPSLNPSRMRIKVNKSTFPYRLSHYEYTFDGKVFRFEPHQVLQIKIPDPNDPFVGIGVPQTIPTWIDSDNYAMEYNRKLFVNGAQVGLFIQTETNVEGNIDRIASFREECFEPQSGRGRTEELSRKDWHSC